MMACPDVTCVRSNHGNLKFEFICLDSGCTSLGRQLSCFNCTQELHCNHLQSVISLRSWLQSALEHFQPTDYNAAEMILSGIAKCRDEQSLRKNVSELLAHQKHPARYEKLLDEDMKSLQNNSQRHYSSVRNQDQDRLNSTCCPSVANLKQFIRPLLNFKAGSEYKLVSPFCVSSTEEKLTTIFAYPSLSAYFESVDCSIKVQRYTPAWLGIGLSINQHKYEEQSAKNIVAISNGWLNRNGKLEQIKSRFSAGDVVTVRWDKNTQIAEFIIKGERHIAKLEANWNDEVHLCVVLYYKNDSVTVLA